MSGMSLKHSQHVELREALRVINVESRVAIEDRRIERRIPIAELDMEKVKDVFHGERDTRDFFGSALKKGEMNLRNQVKECIKNPILTEHEADRVVFQRNVGHLEMPNAHRWTEVFAADCHVCRKLTYTVFVWNKALAQKQLERESNPNQPSKKAVSRKFYNHSHLEPIYFENDFYKYPVLSIGDKVH